MKRVFLALAVAFFGFSVCFLPYTAGAQAAPPITGDWVVQATGDQLIAGTLHLTRVGDTVVGTAKSGNGILQINGTLKGSVLSAKWRAPKGNVGWMTLNFTSTFTGFHGDWGYGGRQPNGSIVGKQLAHTAF